MKFQYSTEVVAEERTGSRHTGPSFTAYETPESRVPRLASAYGFAHDTVKRMSVRYQNAFDGAVINMHDDKGVLQITWRDQEARMLFEGVIAGAWENSGEHIVEHHLR